MGIDAVVTAMNDRLMTLESTGDSRRIFHATYLRTTQAVADAVDDAAFEDPRWVVEWDVAFADLYLDAFDAFGKDRGSAPRPWRLAFSAAADLPPLRHVLLGINAHVNYDLPQALLRVISTSDFDNANLLAKRQRDHQRIDGVLASRVSAEDAALEAASGGRALLDRVLTPLNRIGSKRFLKEAREKVWANTMVLDAARRKSDEAYRRRLGDLEVLSAAKIDDLLRPGQVLLRLATLGFGVIIPPA